MNKTNIYKKANEAITTPNIATLQTDNKVDKNSFKKIYLNVNLNY